MSTRAICITVYVVVGFVLARVTYDNADDEVAAPLAVVYGVGWPVAVAGGAIFCVLWAAWELVGLPSKAVQRLLS